MKAPLFSGKDILTGSDVSMEELLKENDLVIVIFWANWSKRALKELEDFKILTEKFHDKQVGIIGVNVEKQDITQKELLEITAVIKGLQLPFPSIIDSGLNIFYQYGVIAVPSTAIIDPSGILLFGPPGYSLTTRDKIVDSINVYLGLESTTIVKDSRKGYIPKDRASRYYHLSLQLYDKKNYDRALNNIERSLTIDKEYPLPYILRGDIHLKQDSIRKSVGQYAHALSLDSNLVNGWTGQGIGYYHLEEYDTAQTFLGRALSLDSSYIPAYNFLGLCLSKQEKYNEAINCYLKALDYSSFDAQIHYHLGLVYYTTGDIKNAIRSLKTSLEILYPPP